jgi:hypothetical protein
MEASKVAKADVEVCVTEGVPCRIGHALLQSNARAASPRNFRRRAADGPLNGNRERYV